MGYSKPYSSDVYPFFIYTNGYALGRACWHDGVRVIAFSLAIASGYWD